MKHLVIEKADLRSNIAVIKDRAGSAAIYAVLTGNANGAGLVEMAKLLRNEGIGRFAVSEPQEAIALRKAGFGEEEILMLRSTTDPKELDLLIDYNVVCTIGSYDTAVALNGLAEQRSTIVEAHIQVDTGMGYGGFLAGEPDKILSVYRYMPNVALSGIYTQMHGSDSGQKRATGQLELLQTVLESIHSAGFETGTVHAAGSGAFLRYEFAKLDAVRVGSAWLGRSQRTRGDGLVEAGHGTANLAEIRWLPAGHTVGNHKLITLKKPTRVAVLPVGYQNGFGISGPTQLGFLAALQRLFFPLRPTVYIGEQRLGILGQIGAQETLLDVTDSKCVTGDLVSFDINPLYAKGLPVVYQD